MTANVGLYYSPVTTYEFMTCPGLDSCYTRSVIPVYMTDSSDITTLFRLIVELLC